MMALIMEPDPDKIQTVKEMFRPTDFGTVQRFKSLSITKISNTIAGR